MEGLKSYALGTNCTLEGSRWVYPYRAADSCREAAVLKESTVSSKCMHARRDLSRPGSFRMDHMEKWCRKAGKGEGLEIPNNFCEASYQAPKATFRSSCFSIAKYAEHHTFAVPCVLPA